MRRAYTNDFLIDGHPLLAPDENVSITENDLDASDAGRDASGYMHRILVRPGVKTWEFVYSVLDAEDYAYIQSLFRGKAAFQFTYKNADREVVTTTAYNAKRSIVLRNYATGEYKNLKFNIIEC